MQIRYVPPGSRQLSDILVMDDPVARLMIHARRHFTMYRHTAVIPLTCVECGITGRRTDLHHIRPIWVNALEIALKGAPKTSSDIAELVRKFFYDPSGMCECNNPSNLKSLCHKCHVQEDKRAYQLWKEYFEKHYPVVFGVRSKSRIDKLLGGNS